MKKLLIGLAVATLALLGANQAAKAELLFSVEADAPLSYTPSVKSTTAYTPGGLGLQFHTVFLPIGIGMDNYTLAAGGQTVNVNMYDLFASFSFIVNINVGVGIGSMDSKMTSGATTTSFDAVSLTHLYGSVGIPIFPFLKLTAGYHMLNADKAKWKVNGTATGSSTDFSGTMTTVGLMFNF